MATSNRRHPNSATHRLLNLPKTLLEFEITHVNVKNIALETNCLGKLVILKSIVSDDTLIKISIECSELKYLKLGECLFPHIFNSKVLYLGFLFLTDD